MNVFSLIKLKIDKHKIINNFYNILHYFLIMINNTG